jgi:PAS domain S-box-containing protein
MKFEDTCIPMDTGVGVMSRAELHDTEALQSAWRQQRTLAALGLLALRATSVEAVLTELVSHTSEALGGARVEVVDCFEEDGPAAIRALIEDAHQPRAIVALPPDGGTFTPRDFHFLQAVANVASAFIQRQCLDARARRRERWLRAYFERSPDVVLRLDEQARFLDANPAAERILGVSASALRGQSSERLGMSEATFAAWRIAVQQVFGSQRDQALDVHLQTAQGPRMYAAQLTSVLDDQGSVEFVGGILRDVTERVIAEQERRQLQRELLERDDRLQSVVGTLMRERTVLRDRARAWGIAALTPRERTILRLLAGGQTNREIALKLGLSPGTVKNRIGLLLPKLGAADRTQAVAIAMQLGLLDGPSDLTQAAPEPSPLPYFNLGEFE